MKMKPATRYEQGQALRGLGLVFLLSGASFAPASDYTYSFNAEVPGTITLTGYAGAGGVVDIPDQIDGYAVTRIGEYAFAGGNVTNIGYGAFESCAQLTQVSIPEGVTRIGEYAFYNCTNLIAVAIPSSVVSLGESAFENCVQLTGVTLPSGILNIGDWAFASCTALEQVTLPSSLTRIGHGVFDSCTRLNRVILPDSLVEIGANAFQDCSSLTRLVLPAGLTNIGNRAFISCPSLTGAYFRGNAPALAGGQVFQSATNVVAYRLASRTGWGTTYGGQPTALWATNMTVGFDAQGGTVPSPASKGVNFDWPYGALATTARAGHTFGGWWTGASGTGEEVTADTTVTAIADHPLYAKWIGDGSGTPPVLDAIGDREAFLGQRLQFPVTATPTEGEPVTLAVTNLPAGAEFHSTNETGVFVWANAVPPGAYSVGFRASDDDGSDSETVTLRVHPLPEIGAVTLPAGSAASVTVQSVAGREYRLEYTTDLAANPVVWNLADSEIGTGGTITLSDPSPTDSRRFYRVMAP